MARGTTRRSGGGTPPAGAGNTSPTTSLLDIIVDKHLTNRGIVPGGGGPHNPDMEARVTKLETHMEYMRRDLDEIKADNRAVLGKLDGVANALTGIRSDVGDKASTKELWTIVVTVAVLALAVIAAIIGGLDWIKHN